MNCTSCDRRLSVEEYQQIDVLKVCCDTRIALCIDCLFNNGIVERMIRERRMHTCRSCLRNIAGEQLIIKRQYVSFGGSARNHTPERPRGFFNTSREFMTQYQTPARYPYESPLFYSDRPRHSEFRSARQPLFDHKFRYTDPMPQQSFQASTRHSEKLSDPVQSQPIVQNSQRWLPIVDRSKSKMECQEQYVVNTFSGMNLGNQPIGVQHNLLENSSTAPSFPPRPIEPYGQPVIQPYKYIPPPQPQLHIFRQQPIGRMTNSVEYTQFFRKQPSDFLQKEIQKLHNTQDRPNSVGKDYWSTRNQNFQRLQNQNSERPLSSGFQNLSSSLSTRSFREFNQNRQPLPFFNR